MRPTELIEELRAAIEEIEREAHYPDIMTPAQAASFLGVSEDYLRDKRKEKSGPPYAQPAYKIIRYQKVDLIEWLNRSQVGA